MKTRTVHDAIVITLVTVAVFMLFIAGCFLDSDDCGVSICVLYACKFIIAWFILANKDILNRKAERMS